MEEEPIWIKEFREMILELQPELDPEELKVHEERIIRGVKAATQDIGEMHVLGSPLLDILSVSVRLKIPPTPQGYWRIVGDIHIESPFEEIERDGYIFRRNSNNSQFLHPSVPFLTLDHASPIFNFFPCVHLCLKLLAQRPRYSEFQPLVDDTIRLDYTNYPEDMFDTVQHADIDTDNAALCVKYITYRAACIAEVYVSLNLPIGQPSRQLKVSGKIYASWHHTKDDFRSHSEHERNCCCICLFDSHCSLVTTGHLFQLSRSIIAVPSYATLVIEITLRVEDANFYHILDFPLKDMDFSAQDFDVPGGFVGNIKVEWANESLYEKKEEEEEEATTQTRDQKRAKLTIPQVLEPIRIHDTILGRELVGSQKTEIFSVYVEAKDKNTVYRVNGTIEVKDSLGEHKIFEMTEGELTRQFVHGTTLPLIGPTRCIAGRCFLLLDLRDEEGKEFCRGYMGWSGPLLSRPWLDKWLCSIIKGSLGFTEIHYALFTSAVSCAVNVFLAAPSRSEHVYIRGFIACGYDIDYTTTFCKKYERSFLFHEGDDEEEPMLLDFGAKRKKVNIPNPTHVKHNKHWISVPLSKSVVCVPTDNTLQIEVNLSVGCDSVASVEKLMGSMELKIGQKRWYIISGNEVQMFVSFDWSDGF